MDTDAEIAAVDRTLTADGTQRVVTVSRSYRTDLEDLWDACTSAERLPRWFLPVTGMLEVGGRYQLEGNAGGTVTSCDRPHRFTVTWEFGDQTSDLAVDLAAEGPDRARLTLTHTASVDQDFWDQYGPGATGVGWDLGLLGLSLYLATGERPTNGPGWETTEDGRRFITAASTGWGDASVAAGTPEPAARAAQHRTTAFYLGEQAPGHLGG